MMSTTVKNVIKASTAIASMNSIAQICLIKQNAMASNKLKIKVVTIEILFRMLFMCSICIAEKIPNANTSVYTARFGFHNSKM